MTNLPDQPNQSVERRQGHFSDFQRRALARMAVEGIWSRKQMAAVLRVHPTTIDRYLDSDPETLKFIDEYEAEAIKGIVDGRWRMLGLADQAYATIANDLRGQDPRLAHASAWRIVEALMPKGGFGTSYGRQPGEIEVDDAGRQVVIEAVIGLAKVVAEVKDSPGFKEESFMRSVYTGPDALPGPADQAKPSNGGKPTTIDATPEPTDD